MHLLQQRLPISRLAPLQKLAAGEESLIQEIQTFYQQKKGENFWYKYKMVVVLIIALFLCLLIYIL